MKAHSVHCTYNVENEIMVKIKVRKLNVKFWTEFKNYSFRSPFTICQLKKTFQIICIEKEKKKKKWWWINDDSLELSFIFIVILISWLDSWWKQVCNNLHAENEYQPCGWNGKANGNSILKNVYGTFELNETTYECPNWQDKKRKKKITSHYR